MNILFFLTPKSDVAYIFDDDTVRQALEKMEHHRYSSVPIINSSGRYMGAITEGDLLWGMKGLMLESVKDTEKIPVMSIPRRLDYKSVHVETSMESLINLAMSQNFVPVVDDEKRFIGIVTRKDIIQYCYKKMNT